jgi:hypothetical protein
MHKTFEALTLENKNNSPENDINAHRTILVG